MTGEVLDLEDRIRLAIRIGESHYREFKSGWMGPPNKKVPREFKDIATDIAQTLVAFANSDGGELIVGVEDDGTITGVPLAKDRLVELLGTTESRIHKDTPLPSCLKTHIEIDGVAVLYLSVPKGTQYVHLTSDGRCLRRIDRDSIPFSSERITAERLEDQSRAWDRGIQDGATLNDLDLDLTQSVASQIASGISPEKGLQYLDLAEFTPAGLRLKKAAVLLFGKDVRRWHSHCQVRIMTIRGKERRSGEGFNVVKDEQVTDNIIRLVDTAWERLNFALSQHTHLTESGRFEQNFLYPQIACREALINAIVHRNYAIEGRGIEIYIYQDRMEISSPGMLLSTISIEDIKALKGAHESRNPHVARVLREIGLVREMGEGMRRIFDVMKSNALAEPEIESTTAGFTVTLYHKSLYDPNVKLWLSNFDSFKLTENQMAVMALGYAGKEFSTQDVIDRLGIVDTDQVREILTPLRSRGLIQRTLNDAQAIRVSRKNRLPKREVKLWAVVNNTALSSVTAKVGSKIGAGAQPAVPKASLEAAEVLNEGRTHRLFIAKIPYSVEKEGLFQFLVNTCDILELTMPQATLTGYAHRGYAFAVVAFPGTTAELVRKLDGVVLNGSRLHVAVQGQRPYWRS